jgi:hypothetical protein
MSSNTGKIRLKKSLTPSENLINSQGYAVPVVNFNDSFIFTEAGNENVISYDYEDQEWYFDISKLISNIDPKDPKDPDLIDTPDIFNIIDPKGGDSLIYDPIISKFVNSQLLNNSLKFIRDDVDNINSRVDSLESSSVDDSILQSQINQLTSQITELMSVISSQQQIIDSITPLGTPTFRYSIIDKEVPSGQIDGLNSSFILDLDPVPGSETVYINGVMQDPSLDYTLDKKTIIFKEVPISGMKIRCNYRVADDPTITKTIRSMKPPLMYDLDYLQSPAYIYVSVDKEIPQGILNGINTKFTLSNTPIPESESIFLQGILQEPISNYKLINNEIIFTEPPVEGMVIRCSYKIY